LACSDALAAPARLGSVSRATARIVVQRFFADSMEVPEAESPVR
jgi:hypothetical protein